FLCATYLSAGATFPITHNNNVFAQETRPQKELYQVTVTNLTKNKNEMITKFDILNAVQTTALGKVPITKSILKEYEQKLPFTIQKDGYYSFPVQVKYQDGSITEVIVSVVTPYDTPTAKEENESENNHAKAWETAANNHPTKEQEIANEKKFLNVALEDLLTLIQENPNIFPYTEESKNAYTNAISNAYEPYKKGKNIVSAPSATLEDIKKAIVDVEVHKTAITSAKQAFLERQATVQEIETYQTLISQLESILSTPIKTSDKTPENISAYSEVKTRAQSLLDKVKQIPTKNILFNELLKPFKEIKEIKAELVQRKTLCSNLLLKHNNIIQKEKS
ncbi:TPA: hypothetical protein RD632_002887, partial [Enterococcus faecalis]|nr:hypothetical protein [Enterococcus faecalis]